MCCVSPLVLSIDRYNCIEMSEDTGSSDIAVVLAEMGCIGGGEYCIQCLVLCCHVILSLLNVFYNQFIYNVMCNGLGFV